MEQAKRDSYESRRGQICALLITLSAIGAGAYTAIQGHEIAGSILGVGGIGSIVTTFLMGRSSEPIPSPQPPQPTRKNGGKNPSASNATSGPQSATEFHSRPPQ